MPEICGGSAIVLAVISADPGLRKKITDLLEEGETGGSLWTPSDYPAPSQLSPLRQAGSGCLALVDFSDPRRAKMVAAELDHNYANVSMIALCPSRRTPQDLLDLMQFGIREVVDLPFAGPDLLQAVARASRKVQSRQSPEPLRGRIYAFLPAKPGAGATTIATNTAASVARIGDQRTLLIDFDLKLGMTTFLLKLDGQNSVMDALTAGPALDSTLWDRLVCRRNELEILGSAPAEIGQVTPRGSATQVLRFAQQSYETICVDLPGDVSEWELETLSVAREIFLVCSPDLGILHLAKRRSEQLRSLGLDGAISVILNRADSRGSFSIADMEQILQLPVSFSVPSDYVRVAEAAKKGAPLEGRSPVASQLESLARHLNPIGVTGGRKPRKFAEFFSVSPVRDRLVGKH